MGRKYSVSEATYVDRIYVPYVLIPLWQIRLKERYGIEVDRDIVRILVEARYSRSTWKWHRAIKRVSEELRKRGISAAHASQLAHKLVNAVASL
ncbi:hypothetical protein [Candidatus Aciduliprofundum boonei]|uniref:Uncharacterized protein n=1 Tax=Aciduliprofundum boonei (strain DSM 19572 / T469) TaxID=439481 RepID=D3TD26_ACIB4|nr:hypothetical protein [Candidatus Aciduliprofundum boonei]ADD08461.1 hypothetical protein Aboo_0650 [Aciduliprofundum boonei T469]HII55334.1 hypothetical protein [Candidatus Aciduliprofundum boonei]